MARLRKERRKDYIKWEEHWMKDRQRKKETYVNKKYNVSQRARGTVRKDKNQSSKMQNEKEDGKYWAECDSN